jgi:ribosomal protein S12 methylthiotransferase accessory factor
LTYEKIKYLPTAFCYYGKDSPFLFACSNGCAAGNNLEEAILQGFFELVERDSVAIWWYNRIRRPLVDLPSFNEPYMQTLVEEYRSQNRDVWALDVTSDLGIPSFAALSKNRNSNNEILMGFGTHLDAKIGLLRALTEMNQMYSVLDRGGNSSPISYDPEHKITMDWLAKATPENQPYLQPSSKSAKKSEDYPQLTTPDLLGDIAVCRQIIEKKGMEMLVLDQTREDIGLKVVKVIVPGLRHYYPHFAQGRLYDVPVQLGWLQKPKSESEMNPIPMFL